MKKATLVVALALVLIFAFAATASATTGKFFAGGTDYYRWNQRTDSPSPGTAWVKNYVSGIASNTVLPGAHANYLATTAKCGMCHSVHRATAGGVKLLPTDDATCSGCHTGSTAITAKLVTWIPVNTNYTIDGLNGPPGGLGGPHNDNAQDLYDDGIWDGVGTPPPPSPIGTTARYGCFKVRCHATNPHGANSSRYTLFAAKLLFNNSPADDAAEVGTTTVGTYGGLDAVYDNLGATDASVQRFLDANPLVIREDPANTGELQLSHDAGSTWGPPDVSETHALVAGLTCGRPSVGKDKIGNDNCHPEASYAIVDKAVKEQRNHGTGITGNNGSNPLYTSKEAYLTDTTGDQAPGWGGNDSRDWKTGHVAGSFDATAAHASYAPIAGCTSCHDQTDSANTVAGHFTFPHGQTSAGASNLTTDGVNLIPAPTWADYVAGLGVRSRIWTGYSGSVGATLTYTAGTNQKAYDGQCLKCHRDGAGNGIGLTH